MVAAPGVDQSTDGELVVAGDVGGTNARLWLARVRGATVQPVLERIVGVAECAGIDDALDRFARDCRALGVAFGDPAGVRRACLGVAGPVAGDRVRVTNSGWEIDAARVAERLGLERATLVNDFAAAAAGIAALDHDKLRCLQPGRPDPAAPRVVIGAGTGLGVAYLFGAPPDLLVIPGEAGHAGFAPADVLQADLWQHLYRTGGRVEAERVVSGPGLVGIWEFLAASGRSRPGDTVRAAVAAGGAAAIARMGLESGEASCAAALGLFVTIFGAVAGDHALSVLAYGGVFVAGGIAPKLLPLLSDGRFVTAFRDKARFALLACRFPVHVVLDERLGLLGAAIIAASPDR